ncbi:amidohydrolase family protein [Streptomyces sp. DSM 41014]|uniref:Amidohydrolase family protein n=1 Tax=Streptomyces hintoniae TaxID=3075521 RepID=A0ABU2UE02_9ACTN|nr:amidohydrolase family protein [Streptomyces sp. DSM 41014]MDT0471485.1 amidohydrolase family protein [Streptomyces sp. DSM 41014]
MTPSSPLGGPGGHGGAELIDAHVHVWDPRRVRYDWLAGTPLDRPRLPGDVDDADGAVSGWVFVEADAAPEAALDEARWVADLEWPGLAAMVVAADLEAPDAGERIGRAAGLPLVRGVRHLLQGLPGERLAAPALARGLAEVARAGLVFDACVRWTQLDALDRLLGDSFDGTVVLDHLGKPPVDEGVRSDAGRSWLASLRRLARHERLVVKVSGLPAEASDRGTLRRHGPDLVRAAVDVFGAERCMVAGDWPVSVGADGGTTAGEWFGLVREVVGADDWPRVAAGTARAVYGIRGRDGEPVRD